MSNYEIASEFANQRKAVIVAAAGCGKTDLIVKSTMLSNGKQLILTHTHAGIRSLKDRFKKYKVENFKYSISTISGFALHYASSYPQYCNLLKEDYEIQLVWDKIYLGCLKVLDSSFGRMIIKASYNGLFVDEYQDCTINQHYMIESLASLIPCRIVGDPLQGIFDFGAVQIVKWDRDIFPNFERLQDLNYAWRWKDNPEMMEWLTAVRQKLINAEEINFGNVPRSVQIITDNEIRTKVRVCFNYCKYRNDSIVAILKWNYESHKLAQKLNGTYVSMEEMEAKDLFNFLSAFTSSIGCERALLLLNFAKNCMTAITFHFNTLIKKLEKGNTDIAKIKNNKALCRCIIELVNDNIIDMDILLSTLYIFESLPKLNRVIIYRKELYDDLIKSFKNVISGDVAKLSDAAVKIRNRSRIIGRRVDSRVVSRILLIKGLEFDHTILFNADNSNINAKELYVGLTRASKSLTIFSNQRKIRKELPVF